MPSWSSRLELFKIHNLDIVFYQDSWKFLSPDIADGVSPIRSRDAVLTVNVPPEKPIIINGDTLRTTEDREVEIQCVSRGGKPAAEVSIIIQTLTATKHAYVESVYIFVFESFL